MTEKKLTDCYWFLQGQCTKGEACEYRHCEATLDNPVNCKFWMENKCTNPNCSFRHPSIPKKAATVCVFYVQGKCTKGDSCPFSHSIPLKQNEEEEIKKIQEERRKEEEKLLKLKQEAEKLQKQTQQLKESKVRKESPGAVSFVKTLNSIKNEQESKKKSPQEKKSNKQNNNNNNKKVPKKQENQPSNQKGFGVKSLDEIIKDKGPAETVETNPTTQSAPSISKDGFDIQELRKKNLQKFGQSPVNNTSKDNNNATNSVSPKKRQSNEASKENPTAGDPKRRKTEETVTKPPTPTASAKPKVIEEDDFDKELAELAGTDVNTDGTGEADLDDELLNV